jgi:hypothetical protein
MESETDRKLHLLLDHPKYAEDLDVVLSAVPERDRIRVSGRIAHMVIMAIDHGIKVAKLNGPGA